MNTIFKRKLFWFLGIVSTAIYFISSHKAAAKPQDAFHIYSPVIEKGSWGFETITAYQTGLPSRLNDEKINFAAEYAFHADITDYWMAHLAFDTAHEVSEEYKLETISFESVIRADKWSLRTFDAAWYSGLFVATDNAATNSFVFGPVASYYQGPISIIINPFFEQTFGQNNEDGISLTYGWRATYTVTEKISIGVEGYGDIPHLGNSDLFNDQVHRIGPVLYFGQVDGNPYNNLSLDAKKYASKVHNRTVNGLEELSADVGVLFGLTENTSDIAIKWNTYLHF